MGVSAGGVAALHFAVRHPDRTRALALMVPAVYRPDPALPAPDWALKLLDAVVSARRLGLLNDSRLTTGAARVALESIRAPTLAISARDDGYGTYESARYSAEHIAGARFLGFEQGGHALLGHQQEVTDAVLALVRGSAPSSTHTSSREPTRAGIAPLVRIHIKCG